MLGTTGEAWPNAQPGGPYVGACTLEPALDVRQMKVWEARKHWIITYDEKSYHERRALTLHKRSTTDTDALQIHYNGDSVASSEPSGLKKDGKVKEVTAT